MIAVKRTAAVTGGTRGIGLAVSKALIEDNIRVAAISMNQESIDNAQRQFAGIESFRGFLCDVRNVNDIEAAAKEVYKFFGSIDILVNCAGIIDISRIDTLTESDWDNVIDTNLKGAYFMIQKMLPYLEKGNSPRIINIASNAGRMGGFENGLAYTASKGGLIALTYGAARRLAPKGITVNCVAPGTIESDMSAEYDEETHKRLLARFPVGRFGRPEEVAAAVRYFAGVDSGFTTGAVLDVNGGMFMG